VREPATACSVGSSHSEIVALCSGLKLPLFRSPSSTPRTDGGNFNPLHSATISEWELPTEHAVAGSRTLTISVSQN